MMYMMADVRGGVRSVFTAAWFLVFDGSIHGWGHGDVFWFHDFVVDGYHQSYHGDRGAALTLVRLE